MTSDPLGLLAPAPRRPGWLVPVVTAAVALVLGVGGTLVVLSLAGGTDAVPVRGEVRLRLSEANFQEHDNCFGTGGYTDLRGGASVVVTDAAGVTIAVTSLRAGEIDLSGEPDVCALRFEAQVPAGKGFYGVEVTHRGRVQIPEAQLGKVELAIG
jgi:hypothetical protein